MISTRCLLALALLNTSTAGLAGTTFTVRPVASQDGSQEEVGDASAMLTERAEQVATLAKIEALVASGDAAAAREALSRMVAPGVDRLAAGRNGAEFESFLRRVNRLAESTRQVQLQRDVWECLVGVLEASCGPEDPRLLETRVNLARMLGQQGDLRGASKLYESVYAVQLRILAQNDPVLLSLQENVAVCRLALGNPPGAVELFDTVHGQRESLLDPQDPVLLRTKAQLAQACFFAGEFDRALELRRGVLEVCERTLQPGDFDLLAAKLSLAISISHSGDVATALVLTEEVLAVWEKVLPAEDPQLLNVRYMVARSHYELGHVASAGAEFETLYAVQSRLLPPDHPNLLSVTIALIETRRLLGDSDGALALRESTHAYQARVLPPDHPDLLAARSQLATMRLSAGDARGALELYESVVEARERTLPPDNHDVLDAKYGVAGALLALGDVAGARAAMEGILETYEATLPAHNRRLLGARAALAGLRHRAREFAGADEEYRAVLAASEAKLGPKHPWVLVAKQNVAALRHALGDVEGARTLCLEVLDASAPYLPPHHEDVLGARLALANADCELGNYESLGENIRAILTAQREVATAQLVQAPRPARASARRELDRIADLIYFAGVVAREGGPALASEILVAIEALRAGSSPSMALARTARADRGLTRQLDELAVVRSKLADLVSAGAPEEAKVDSWRKSMVELSEVRDSLEREVRSRLHESGESIELPSLASIVGGLPKDGAFVTYIRHRQVAPIGRDKDGVVALNSREGAQSLTAFVATPDGRVQSVDLGPTGPVESAVVDWRRALGRSLESRAPGLGVKTASEESTLDESGLALRARILDPVLAVLPEVKTLVVVPDDVIFLVPLDALPDRDGVVGDRIKVHATTSSRPLASRAERKAEEVRLLALGGVDYGGGAAASGASTRGPLLSLPGTLAEVESIAALFLPAKLGGVVTLTGAEADKQRFIESARGASYVHVATHGWFSDELASTRSSGPAELDAAPSVADAMGVRRTILAFLPETLCGLAFAGANRGVDALGRSPGILTAEELSTVDLAACDLAVLSACETNVGVREAGLGIQSLQTALHAAGARSAITSLWAVDDEATRQLFECFYAKLWGAGVGKAEALWMAKRALRDAGRPLRDWAAWVLTGEHD